MYGSRPFVQLGHDLESKGHCAVDKLLGHLKLCTIEFTRIIRVTVCLLLLRWSWKHALRAICCTLCPWDSPLLIVDPQVDLNALFHLQQQVLKY